MRSQARAGAFAVSVAFELGTIPRLAAQTATGDLRTASALGVAAPIHHVDVQNREPMVAQLASGTLLVTGFPRVPHRPARAPSLWKSEDNGITWTRVDVGTPADAAMGNSDVDLAVAPDGTVYFVSMGFDRTAGEGTHITVGVSHSAGSAWEWTYLSQDRLVDRPWVEVAPDGTAHVIWNDGNGVRHAMSTDRGRSWRERSRVHPRGGSSHLAIGPRGEVAVRITPLSASGNRHDPGVDLIAVSTDAGSTWAKTAAPGTRHWVALGDTSAVPRWVEPLAWGPDGALYYLWSEGERIRLGRSRDDGRTWTHWLIAETEGRFFFPYLVAHESGRLAASWFSSADDSSVRVALIDIQPTANGERPPRRLVSPPIPLESFLVVDGDRRRDTAGEYVPVLFLADGDLAAVTPLQDPDTERFGFSFWRIDVR